MAGHHHKEKGGVGGGGGGGGGVGGDGLGSTVQLAWWVSPLVHWLLAQAEQESELPLL